MNADGGSDAPPEAPGDALTDGATEACAPTENCSNGVDDNCNGLVDCQDPACGTQGFACAPSTPAGWSVVDFAANAQPPCSTGYANPAPFVEGPDAAAGCTCQCGAPNLDPCAQGTVSLALGQTGCGCRTISGTSDGHCDSFGAPIPGPCPGFTYGTNLTPPLGVQQVACAVTPQLPPLTFAAMGRSCSPDTDGGGGCEAGGCYPTVAAGSWCIATAGNVTCPPGFTRQHVIYAPASVMDTRACNGCACGSNASTCSGARLTVYTDSACTLSPITMTADGICDTFSGDPTGYQYFRYTAMADTAGCSQQGTPTVGGGITATSPMTVCCP